jgi:hypothetical protein
MDSCKAQKCGHAVQGLRPTVCVAAVTFHKMSV